MADNEQLSAIRSGLESQLVIHSEEVVFQSDDESQFAVIRAEVSVADGAPETGDGRQEHHPMLFAQVRGGQPGAVCVAERSDGRLLLVNHWRIATQSYEWEFPRSMGVPGERAVQTAAHELLIETGLKSSNHRVLQMIHADTCKLRDAIAVVAMDVDAETTGIGDDPRLAWLDPADIDTMIAEGSIMDGVTLAAYLVWRADRAEG